MTRTHFPNGKQISPYQYGHIKRTHRPSDKNMQFQKSIDERETADVSINNTGYITNLELTGIETTVNTINIYTD